MSKEKKLKYNRSNLHFSKEQKIRIVQEIESGQLTRKEAMRKYNVVGHQTLNSWLLQYAASPDGVVRKRYDKSDQRLAAYKVITGEATLDQVARDMQIAPGTVSGWVRLYKKDIQQKPAVLAKKTQPQETSLSKDQQKELEELRLKVAGLEMMIDIAEKDLKIDIRKKSGTKQ
jgi:transposase